jgi:hypothetical protein
MNWELFGRNRSWPTRGNILVFAWSDSEQVSGMRSNRTNVTATITRSAKQPVTVITVIRQGTVGSIKELIDICIDERERPWATVVAPRVTTWRCITVIHCRICFVTDLPPQFAALLALTRNVILCP